MSTSAIGGFSGSSLQQVLASAFQSAGLNTKAPSGAAQLLQSDSSHLSPFAQLASALQQLQQTDPTKYAQVTKDIAANLQTAAQTAQSKGDTTAANQLTKLAADFTSASQTGQLPNLQDLANALRGGGGGHHHAHADNDSDAGASAASSGSTASTGTTTSQALNQLLSALQTLASQNSQGTQSQSAQGSSQDPAAIILKTLSDAGVSVSTSGALS
jgi:hypothetical protein